MKFECDFCCAAQSLEFLIQLMTFLLPLNIASNNPFTSKNYHACAALLLIETTKLLEKRLTLCCLIVQSLNTLQRVSKFEQKLTVPINAAEFSVMQNLE